MARATPSERLIEMIEALGYETQLGVRCAEGWYRINNGAAADVFRWQVYVRRPGDGELGWRELSSYDRVTDCVRFGFDVVTHKSPGDYRTMGSSHDELMAFAKAKPVER